MLLVGVALAATYLATQGGKGASLPAAPAGALPDPLPKSPPPPKPMGVKKKCEPADAWFYNIVSQGAARTKIPCPPEVWESLNCTEKKTIMANPILGAQFVLAQRYARDVEKSVSGAAAQVQNVIEANIPKLPKVGF